MSAADNQCQPKGVAALAHYVEMRTKQPMLNLGASVHSIHLGTEYAAEISFFDIAEAVNSNASLKADLAQCTEANHHYRDAVDVLESNARVQAKLLADTGRRVKELEGALQLLWAETIASGNADAKDYGWPKARAATLAALSPKPAGETKS